MFLGIVIGSLASVSSSPSAPEPKTFGIGKSPTDSILANCEGFFSSVSACLASLTSGFSVLTFTMRGWFKDLWKAEFKYFSLSSPAVGSLAFFILFPAEAILLDRAGFDFLEAFDGFRTIFFPSSNSISISSGLS